MGLFPAPLNTERDPQSAVAMTPEESLVWGMLWLARGRKRAVPLKAIARRTQLSDRQIKQAARDLVMRHNLLIGAVREHDGGYYRIETAEELAETVAVLKNQAVNMLRRCYVLLGKSNIRLLELLGQLELDIQCEEYHGS